MALVAPESLRWIIKSNREGKPRPRVGFTLCGEEYNLPLTDPLWEPRLQHLAPGSYPPEAGGLGKDDAVLLTISLSEPFQADDTAPICCYKLVAAVMTLPEFRSLQRAASLHRPDVRKHVATSDESLEEMPPHPAEMPHAELPAEEADAADDSFPISSNEHEDVTAAMSENLPEKPLSRFDKMREAVPRAFMKWTAEEDAELTRLLHSGLDAKAIAARMQRHEGAVTRRMEKLELSPQTTSVAPAPQQEREARMPTDAIRVAISGAAGRMGREVVRAIQEAEGMEPVAAIDRHALDADAGELAGIGKLGVLIESDLETALIRSQPDVLVDFTVPDGVMNNLRIALARGISPVVGTTGLSADNLAEIDREAKARGIGAFVAPNFAIGAVLMMQFAAQAARYLPDVEIIELHHEKKLDSPSGTALLTAQRIAEARREAHVAAAPVPSGLIEKAPGARGARNAATGDVPIHSVRLPGFVAHQEVIFGGPGQILTLRHDSTDRRSFMPGVVLAVRKVRGLNGLVVGLENLL